MLDDANVHGLFSLAESNYLRLEAMDLFERCLTEGNPDLLVNFIEQQIAQDPPRLDVLHDVAEDLHRRLLSLREYHFDVREQVLRTLRTDFQVDMSPIAPAHMLHTYHLLELGDVIEFLRKQNSQLTRRDYTMVRKMLEASLEMAGQLYDDVVMTEELLYFVMDWIDGLNAAAARRSWLNEWEVDDRPVIH